MAGKLNPLRVDPTRTTMLRKKFLSDMGKRFRGLRGSIRNLVVVEDAFGLKQRVQNPVLATQTATYRTLDTDVVTNTRWQFETADAKVDDYRAWLKTQVQAGILQVSDDNQETPWLEPYIRSAYKQGLLRAYHDTTGMATTAANDWAFIEGGKAAFLNMAFNTPEAEAKIRLLATRAYSQLEGVTASMDAEMSRILATGLANGSGPGEIGRELNQAVSKLQRTRANTIARTETTYAHSEGQLDSFAAMNIEEVGVMAEWNTAHDGKVCPVCRPLEGVVMTVDEARSLIPRHPNCRCAWLPANVEEQGGGTTKSVWLDGGTTGQVYAKDEADTRIRKSLRAEKPGLSTKDAREASTWTGADAKISPKKKPKAYKPSKKLDDLKKALAEKQAATRAEKIKEAKRWLEGTPEYFEEKLEEIEEAEFHPWEKSDSGWTETVIFLDEHEANIEEAYVVGQSGDTVLFEEVVWGNTTISKDGIRDANVLPKSKQEFAAVVYKKDGGYYPMDDGAANSIAAQYAKHGPDAMIRVQVFDLDAMKKAAEAAENARAELMKAVPFEGELHQNLTPAELKAVLDSGFTEKMGAWGKGVYLYAGKKKVPAYVDKTTTAVTFKVNSKNRLDLEFSKPGWEKDPRYIQWLAATENKTPEEGRQALLDLGYDSLRIRYGTTDMTVVLDTAIIDVGAAGQEVLETKLKLHGLKKADLQSSAFGAGGLPKLTNAKLSDIAQATLPPELSEEKFAEIFEHAFYDIEGGFDAQIKYITEEANKWLQADLELEKQQQVIEALGLKHQLGAVKFYEKKVPPTLREHTQNIDAAWQEFQKMKGWQKPGPGKTQSYGVILFDSEGRILMRQPSGEFGGVKWTFAKGGGSHKLPASTALAELGEETGWSADLVAAMPKGYEGQSTKTNFFIGRAKAYDVSIMDAETLESEFLTYAQAHAMIMQATDPKVRLRDMKILNDAYGMAFELGKPGTAIGSTGNLQLGEIASVGGKMLGQQKKVVAAALQSHKVKLGMAKKHYAKPKFGGGLLPIDYDTPDKLATTGINKVLSEKGWHLQTVAPEVDEALAGAANMVEQKAIMDALKKAPKGTKKIPLPLEAPPVAVVPVQEYLDADSLGGMLMAATDEFGEGFATLKTGRYKSTVVANMLRDAMAEAGVTDVLSKSQIGLISNKAADKGRMKWHFQIGYDPGDVLAAQKAQIKATTEALNELVAEAMAKALPQVAETPLVEPLLAADVFSDLNRMANKVGKYSMFNDDGAWASPVVQMMVEQRLVKAGVGADLGQGVAYQAAADASKVFKVANEVGSSPAARFKQIEAAVASANKQLEAHYGKAFATDVAAGKVAEQVVDKRAFWSAMTKADAASAMLNKKGHSKTKFLGLSIGEDMAVMDGAAGLQTVQTRTIGGVVAPMTEVGTSKLVQYNSLLGHEKLMKTVAIEVASNKKLRLSQKGVSTGKMAHILDNYDPTKANPVVVVDVGGEYVVMDGHHTLTAAWARGERPQIIVYKPTAAGENAIKQLPKGMPYKPPIDPVDVAPGLGAPETGEMYILIEDLEYQLMAGGPTGGDLLDAKGMYPSHDMMDVVYDLLDMSPVELTHAQMDTVSKEATVVGKLAFQNTLKYGTKVEAADAQIKAAAKATNGLVNKIVQGVETVKEKVAELGDGEFINTSDFTSYMEAEEAPYSKGDIPFITPQGMYQTLKMEKVVNQLLQEGGLADVVSSAELADITDKVVQYGKAAFLDANAIASPTGDPLHEQVKGLVEAMNVFAKGAQIQKEAKAEFFAAEGLFPPGVMQFPNQISSWDFNKAHKIGLEPKDYKKDGAMKVTAINKMIAHIQHSMPNKELDAIYDADGGLAGWKKKLKHKALAAYENVGYPYNFNAGNKAIGQVMEAEWARLQLGEKGAKALAAKAAVKKQALKSKKLSAKMAAEKKQALQDAHTGSPEMSQLKYVKQLPGSTKPYKAKHAITGDDWVVKSLDRGTMTEAHMRSEVLTDQLYRAAGLDVPESMIIDDTTGVAKVSRWIEGGQSLEDWMATATPSEVDDMFEQISEGFVADALFANHDVAGMSYDNIFIAGGKPYRIDNGGGLLFRAQGAPKQNFGTEVLELVSMRDKKYSKPNSKIFANITDDKINQQIRSLLDRKQRILGLVDDPALRGTLAARFDYLEARLPKRKGPPRPRGLKRAAYEVTPNTIRKIKENKSNGFALAVDKDYIEDHNMLAWQEFAPDGGRQTVLSAKLTRKGSKTVGETIRTELLTAGMNSAADTTHTDDDLLWDQILPIVKNVVHHSPGGEGGKLQFNEEKRKDLRRIIRDLRAAVKKETDPTTKEMLNHYRVIAEETMTVMSNGKGFAPGWQATQYIYKPGTREIKKAASTPKAARKFRATKFDKIPHKRASKFKDGEIYRSDQNYSSYDAGEGETYVIDAGDGILVRYVPVKSKSRDEQPLQALQGSIEIQMPGVVTEAKIKQAMTVLEDLGINTAPPTPIEEELLYLHRGIYQHNLHNNVAYKRMWGKTYATPDSKLAAMKEYIKTKTSLTGGKEVDVMPGYDPHGRGKHAEGGGHRVFYRWDITRQQMGEEMRGYVLQSTTQSLNNSPKGAVEEAVRGIMASGGEFTSTTGRIRKGVSLSDGDSVRRDIKTGGANYWFTRIKPELDDRRVNGFFFDIRELARQDSVSYTEDEYGAINKFYKRGATPRRYKQFAKSVGNNETNFKEGLTWDQLDYIRVRPEELESLLDAFDELGITHLPDGRPVAKIITTTKQPPLKRYRKGYVEPAVNNH